MGMLATVMNALAISDAFVRHSIPCQVMSGFPIGGGVCDPVDHNKAKNALTQGEVVIFSAGTGSPFFTTDSAAALRAIEIDANVILKGTRVDGIYTADPEKDPSAEKFDEITFSEVFEKGLKVMDMTAFTLCNENDLPIVVFDMNKEGNLLRLMQGEEVGTKVKAD